ncbi:uncharacterized protein LOC130749654 [Lotus japonicus]|uniref:uncharacterized protein LOC130749654 n=1 Tax=Lotus japonicus TaxID=34305 RepID=UPI0025898753|nr:uncharacterized protein LOC130749654 [Lotus japonicus]
MNRLLKIFRSHTGGASVTGTGSGGAVRRAHSTSDFVVAGVGIQSFRNLLMMENAVNPKIWGKKDTAEAAGSAAAAGVAFVSVLSLRDLLDQKPLMAKGEADGAAGAAGAAATSVDAVGTETVPAAGGGDNAGPPVVAAGGVEDGEGAPGRGRGRGRGRVRDPDEDRRRAERLKRRERRLRQEVREAAERPQKFRMGEFLLVDYGNSLLYSQKKRVRHESDDEEEDDSDDALLPGEEPSGINLHSPNRRSPSPPPSGGAVAV